MYVSGYVIPVPEGQKEAYRQMAEEMGAMFREFGASEIVECWEDEVPDGKQTDFRRAVAAEDGERIVFSWAVWPDRAAYDKAVELMQKDERMEAPAEMPFDGKRMIYGSFEPIYVSGR